jgi:hypothetical protein
MWITIDAVAIKFAGWHGVRMNNALTMHRVFVFFCDFHRLSQKEQPFEFTGVARLYRAVAGGMMG